MVRVHEVDCPLQTPPSLSLCRAVLFVEHCLLGLLPRCAAGPFGADQCNFIMYDYNNWLLEGRSKRQQKRLKQVIRGT